MFATPIRSCAFKNLSLFIRPRIPKSFQVKTYCLDGLLDKNGLPRTDIQHPYLNRLKAFSSLSDIAPPKVWFKLVNPESNWDRVSLEEVEYVADLKDAIKIKASRKLNAYDASDLTVKATKQTDDASQALELDARKDLVSILKDLNVESPTEDSASIQRAFAENIWLFVNTPTATDLSSTSIEKKRKAEELFTQLISAKRFKEWHVNSTIFPERRAYYYYADRTEQNQSLIEQVAKGKFVRMYGPRASGKSSRVWQAMEQLASHGYECIYVSLEDSEFTSEEVFWRSFGRLLRDFRLPVSVESSSSFREAFSPSFSRWQRPVVLFIDEFDRLHGDECSEACSSVLSTIRGIRNDKGRSIINSIFMIGTFAILELNQTKQSLPAFNVTENFESVSLTEGQVQDLYKNYSNEHEITIEPTIVEDIYDLTRGHAGLVCLCGHTIHRHLYPDISKEGTLSLETWRNLANKSLQAQITGYSTFQKLIDTLTEKKHRDAVDFLRMYFVGNSDFVSVYLPERRRLASFLAAQGVLQSNPQDESAGAFKMSSPLIDGLIRQVVIPAAYPNCPNTAVPMEEGSLDIIGMLKEAIKFFDKDLITRAPNTAYKTAEDVRVDGIKDPPVPQETVYDQEMFRILMNWLYRQHNYKVIGQYHTTDPKLKGSVKGNHKYIDIVIKKEGTPTVVLEFLATGAPRFIKDHVEKAPIYQKRVFADVSWVIHFTRRDGYLENTKPTWQSDEALNMGVNLVHIWHDKSFTKARMGARWKDKNGNVHQIDNEMLTV